MLVVVLQKFQNASFEDEQFANENDFKMCLKFLLQTQIKSKLSAFKFGMIQSIKIA